MAGSAQPSPQLDAVAFDYGGVLTTPLRDTIAAWQAADGIDPASFTLMLKEWLSPNGQQDTPVHRLETGRCSAAQFGVLLAALLHTDAATTRAAIAALVPGLAAAA